MTKVFMYALLLIGSTVGLSVPVAQAQEGAIIPVEAHLNCVPTDAKYPSLKLETFKNTATKPATPYTLVSISRPGFDITANDQGEALVLNFEGVWNLSFQGASVVSMNFMAKAGSSLVTGNPVESYTSKKPLKATVYEKQTKEEYQVKCEGFLKLFNASTEPITQ